MAKHKSEYIPNAMETQGRAGYIVIRESEGSTTFCTYKLNHERIKK